MRVVIACGLCVITEHLHIYADALPRLALKLCLLPPKIENKTQTFKDLTFEVSIDIKHVTEGTTPPPKP